MVEAGLEAKRRDVARYLRLLPYPKVRQKIIDSLAGRPLPIERVPIDVALGRVSTETIVSPYDVPTVPTSVMDGYAIRSIEISKANASHPVRFNVKGSLYPGSEKPSFPLKGRDAYYMATGAPVPDGSDAVVKVEETRLVDGQVSLSMKIPKWKNIALPGEDIRAGAKVMRKGQIVNAADIALLIEIGFADLSVFRKPKIGILSTGDELTSLSRKEAGKKVNNYSNLIAGYLTDAGAFSTPLGVAKDD